MEQALERGALYVVGTPIGNLGDFSPRARETLEGADFIAAEDTRVTLRLLNHFGIKKPLISYFEHNKLEPVSYTHLDVYKRQRRAWAAPPLPTTGWRAAPPRSWAAWASSRCSRTPC